MRFPPSCRLDPTFSSAEVLFTPFPSRFVPLSGEALLETIESLSPSLSIPFSLNQALKRPSRWLPPSPLFFLWPVMSTLCPIVVDTPSPLPPLFRFLAQFPRPIYIFELSLWSFASGFGLLLFFPLIDPPLLLPWVDL